MGQTPEEKALLDAALGSLLTILPVQVVVKLVRGLGPAVLRVGPQAVFGLAMRPGWATCSWPTVGRCWWRPT